MIYGLLEDTARPTVGMTLVLSSRRTEQELCQIPQTEEKITKPLELNNLSSRQPEMCEAKKLGPRCLSTSGRVAVGR